MRIFYETIIDEFFDSTDAIPSIYMKYKKIIEYYEKNNGYSYHGKDIIYKYIKDYLFPLLNKPFIDQKDIDGWIKEIKFSNTKDYIYIIMNNDKNIDYKLIYDSFVEYVDSLYHDYSYDERAILDDAKIVGYYKLFNDIKYKFLSYLENKVKEDNFFTFDGKNVIRYKKEQLI